VAQYDYDKAVRIIQGWPIREVLVAYMHQLRLYALRQHELATLTWASLAPHQKKQVEPPRLPNLLRRGLD